MIARTCKHCGADISKRHWIAKQCLKCGLKVWGRITGANKAASMVNRAVKKGLLQPAKQCTCVDCGKQAMDYDHRDYNKPLEVVPVCRSCNKKRGPAIPATGFAYS